MSTLFPFRVSRWPRWLVIFDFCVAYIYIISSYIYGYISGEIEMRLLILSIIFFSVGCGRLLDVSIVIEPRLSRRASIALVTTGLCLYAPAPYLVLQGYLRLNPQFLREPGNLADLVFMVLILASLLLIYGVNRYYKKSLVTETQRT